MIHTSAELLEYPALKELLGRFVSSPLGWAELEALAPQTDREALEAALSEVGEALDYLRAAGQPQTAGHGSAIRVNFSGLPDATVPVQKLRIEGAVLEARELYDLLGLLDRADEARSVLSMAGGRFPQLSAKAAHLGDFRAAVRDLGGKILPDGTVDDHASVALNRLRREIERQKRHIEESLERFLRSHQDEGVLQEEYVTLRDDRFVVPIVSGARRRVDGVIHGASGSGRTLFVEPLETIQLNNELVRLRDEEMHEVFRILREMTERLRTQSPEISATLTAMGELEWLFARAEFGVQFGCVVPRFSPEDDRKLVLKEARHPLLQDILRPQGKKVVPISLGLTETQTILLISGPNTGGKTVTMKTVGLLALMAQSGLPVPALEAEFPLFDQVLADIGDNQSLAESLSSFSAHVARIKRIEELVTYRSLVLLDELGRATDPEEGGALGVAILEQFRLIGPMVVASTHLLLMKVYGANTAGVLNASMGFDEETLQPTYLLRVGAPGKSAGLDIASRLGLPPRLIERARQAMGERERDVSHFLQDLHARLDAVADLERTLKQREAEAERKREQLEKDFAKRDAARVRELEKKSEEAIQRFEAQSRQTIREIAEMAEQRKAVEQAQRRIAKAKREFRTDVAANVTGTGQQKTAPPSLAHQIQEGVRVRLRGVREPARVRRILHNDVLEVEAGFLRLQVPLDDVTEVLPSGDTGGVKLPKNVTFSAGPKWDVVSREVNVIGKRAEEAVDEVDKFLDDASMASIDRVRVVHGFGMGVLKRAVNELLRKHPHVDKFYPAPRNEGGEGATIVELKAG